MKTADHIPCLPPRTPRVVEEAIAAYARTRRSVRTRAWSVSCVAVASATILGFVVLDRFVECPSEVRAAGPWLAAAVLAAAAIGRLVIRRRAGPDAAITAIRLDRSFPENEDRWGTVVDLTRRMESGEHVGSPVCVERLLADTEERTTAARVPRTVGRAGVWAACSVLAAVAASFVFLALSPAFDLPLLLRRFCQPGANLPRDSFTRIHVTELNGAPYPGGPIAPLPEGSPFSVRIALERRRGVLPFAAREEGAAEAQGWDPPRIELLGSAETQRHEFSRAGGHWYFAIPRLTQAISFRVRAADGLSATYRQKTVPRIRLESLLHTIHPPKYSRIASTEPSPLPDQRLSLLSGSRIDFEAVFDRPLDTLEVTFEVLQKASDSAGQALTREDLLKLAPHRSREAQPSGPQRRPLRVTRRGDTRARFRLEVEENGILRLRAVGRNGLPGEELVRSVEAIPDAPPRVTLSGIEPDTTIIPGELVAYSYHAEDDFAVTDLFIEWQVAGGATVSDLAGEEYISATNLGQKVVAGSELIRRMNYKVYATAPFEFRVVATDSKGQEARTPFYRIHIVDDDYTARYQRGMEYVGKMAEGAGTYLSYFSRMLNRLNIISAAVGSSATWPQAQDALYDELMVEIDKRPHPFMYQASPYVQRFGGFPYRLDRSAAMLTAPEYVLPVAARLRTEAEQLKTTQDLPSSLAVLRGTLGEAAKLAGVWADAASAEHRRFLPSLLAQKVRKLQARIAELKAVSGNADLRAANLEFYTSEIRQILETGTPLVEQDAALAPMFAEISEAIEASTPGEIADLLAPLATRLFAMQPAGEALLGLAAELARQAAASDAFRERLGGACGDLVRAEGDAALFLPFGLVTLARTTFPTETFTAEWTTVPVQVGDVYLLLDRIQRELHAHRMSLLAGRYELFARARRDRDDRLREWTATLRDMVAACPGIPEPLRTQLTAWTIPADGEEYSAALLRTDAELPDAAAKALHTLGSSHLDGLDSRISADLSLLTGRVHHIAARYRAHAAAVRAAVATTTVTDERTPPVFGMLAAEARGLALRLEGIEAWFRALHFLHTRQRLRTVSGATGWPGRQDLHGVQLALTTCAVRAQERIRFRYQRGPWDKLTADLHTRCDVVARNSEELAAELDVYATLLDALAKGGAGAFDFGALMSATRTTGHLEALQQEFDFVAPFVGGDSAGLSEQREQLAGATLGKIAIGERTLVGVANSHREIESAAVGTAGPALAAVGRLASALTDAGAEDVLADVLALQRDLEAEAGDRPISQSPVLVREMSSLGQTLTELEGEMRAALQLPPVNVTARSNRRYTSIKGTPYIWTIQAIVNSSDQRWLIRMQEAELALVRDLTAIGFPRDGNPGDAGAAALQYARLLELRARNIANERRRNRGISFLAEEQPSSLRLPEHIAREFLKARNREPPVAFKDWSEKYYERLYRDVAE